MSKLIKPCNKKIGFTLNNLYVIDKKEGSKTEGWNYKDFFIEKKEL